MKKIFYLLILLLVGPLMVNAAVTESTPVTTWDISEANAKTNCYDAEAQNDSSTFTNATNGYYLYCIEISCTSSKIAYNIQNPFKTSMVSCSNGNTNLYYMPESGSVSKTGQYTEGSACTGSGVIKYATEKIYYNCAKNNDSSGSDYVPTSNNSTNTSTNTNTGTSNTGTNSGTTNVKTGVSDYYLVLGSIIGFVCIVLYIINKKSLFKKI
jgi:hypothetical protein